MQKVFINRFFSDSKQTLGVLTTTKSNKEIFTCKTLELAWKNNDSNVSCIPEGEYVCRWTRSNRLSTAAGHSVFTFEVEKVSNRAGIRIHSANYFFQLLGCIALGDSHKDINMDKNLDVIHSGATIEKFAKVMNYDAFLLVIKNQF